jgi:hypothetical protein
MNFIEATKTHLNVKKNALISLSTNQNVNFKHLFLVMEQPEIRAGIWKHDGNS